MSSRGALILGTSGFATGAAAAALEGLPILDLEDQDRTTIFYAIAALSVTTLLTAILLALLRAAQHMKERPTQVQPVVDAFLIGISMGRITQSAPDGRTGHGEQSGPADTAIMRDREKAP